MRTDSLKENLWFVKIDSAVAIKKAKTNERDFESLPFEESSEEKRFVRKYYI